MNNNVWAGEAPTLSALIKTNRLLNKRDVIYEQKWLTDRRLVRSGCWWFVRDPPWRCPRVITCSACYWFNPESLCQTPTGTDPCVSAARSRVRRLMTSFGHFTVGRNRLLLRWLTGRLNQCHVLSVGKSRLIKITSLTTDSSTCVEGLDLVQPTFPASKKVLFSNTEFYFAPFLSCSILQSRHAKVQSQ